MKNFGKLKDKIYKYIFGIFSFSSLFFLLGITLILFQQGLPVFKTVSFSEFIFGLHWYPTHEAPEYGILPIIIGSFVVSLGAMIICVPLGIGSALYIHELAGKKLREILKPLIEILAAIPSIIYGFYGMVIVAPTIQKLFNIPIGLNVFTASLILGIMAVPTVCSIAEDALNSVPNSFREASYAIGANRWQTLTKVVIPAAGSGISTAVILGMSRAIGETMTVLMVAGNAAIIPKSIFDPVRPMTSTIALEMGESVIGSPHYHALFAIALLLFIITFLFNIVAEIISRRFRIKLGLQT